MKECTEIEKIERIDPDPISIILAILGALGSVASIASYLEGRKEKGSFWQNDSISDENRAKLIEAIADIEANLIQTEARVHKLKLFIDIYRESKNPISNSPFRFGEVKLFFNYRTFQEFSKLHTQTLTLTSKIIKSVYIALRLIDELNIEVSNSHYKNLIELQHNLNEAISGQINYEQAIEIIFSAIDSAKRTIEKMKNDFGLSPDEGPNFAPR